jgi:ankyrin repeat protein
LYLDGDSLLHIAYLFESYVAAAFLLDLLKLEDLCITDTRGNTPLYRIATRTQNTKSHVDIAQRLVHANNGVTANIKNANGDLPLHGAYRLDDEEVFALLINNTRSLDEENNLGKKVLELVVRRHLNY